MCVCGPLVCSADIATRRGHHVRDLAESPTIYGYDSNYWEKKERKLQCIYMLRGSLVKVFYTFSEKKASDLLPHSHCRKSSQCSQWSCTVLFFVLEEGAFLKKKYWSIWCKIHQTWCILFIYFINCWWILTQSSSFPILPMKNISQPEYKTLLIRWMNLHVMLVLDFRGFFSS